MKYDKAYIVLEEIRKSYGLSVWMLDCYGLLSSFSENDMSLGKNLDEMSNKIYVFLNRKNNLAEWQTYFRNRMKHVLSKNNHRYATYLKYKLFCEMPFEDFERIDENCRNVLHMEGGNSLIDIYLTTVDCLQCYSINDKTRENHYIKQCMDLIASINTPVCQLMSSCYFKKEMDYEPESTMLEFQGAMSKNEFSKVCRLFNENGHVFFDVFNAYRFVAISYLHINEKPDASNVALYNRILMSIYAIMRKEGIVQVNIAIESIRILSRILRSFNIHKGLCIFLDLECNINSGY